MTKPATIVWLKRDLRTADHRPLAEAASRGPCLPLYVAEPELWRQPDRSGRQWAATASALARLRDGLARAGLPLAIAIGDAALEVSIACARLGATTVLAHRETGTRWTHERDRSVAGILRGAGIEFRECAADGVGRGSGQRPDGDFLGGPPADGQWSHARPPGEWGGAIPDGRALGIADDPCEAQPDAPAAEALGRFLERAHAGGYFRNMWNAEDGGRATSRLSVALATGEIASGRVLEEARGAWRRSGPAERRTLEQFASRIAWRRDFVQRFEDMADLEPHPRNGEARHPERLAAWEQGRTGVPMVDATMRSLRATGWATFRMRHMAISFANHHLALDWRETGLELARLFPDYEPGIHWCQLAMMAGTPGHPLKNVYDPVKQGRENDADERFVRRWLPELAKVTKGFAHEPWTIRPDMAPIVDPTRARREALDRIAGKERNPKGNPTRLI